MILLPPSFVSDACCTKQYRSESPHQDSICAQTKSRPEKQQHVVVLACLVAQMILLAINTALPGKLQRPKFHVSLCNRTTY